MRDDDALLAMRPEIPGLNSEHASQAEQFQNNTLRPILKFQHELLVQLLADLPHVKTLRAQSQTKEEFKGEIIDLLKQKSDVKNQILGLVIGHFTLTEYSNYWKMKTELNKRIIQMSGERIAGSVWNSNFSNAE
jgi:hypothetical protein